MMKILVPVDGSDTSLRAIDHLITKMRAKQGGLDVHLINVQPPLPFGGHVSSVVGHENVEDYHREEGLKALAMAQQKLDAAGIAHHSHVAVGDPGDVIVQYAKEHGVDQVLMGTHGRGAVATAIMGSVARDVLSKSDIPVVLVK